jgi:hypothetical protein
MRGVLALLRGGVSGGVSDGDESARVFGRGGGGGGGRVRARRGRGILVCMQAEAEAMQRAVAHGDVGISTPAADGGESFIAATPNGRAPYQPLQMVGRSKL